jgi:hypothetical protein
MNRALLLSATLTITQLAMAASNPTYSNSHSKGSSNPSKSHSAAGQTQHHRSGASGNGAAKGKDSAAAQLDQLERQTAKTQSGNSAGKSNTSKGASRGGTGKASGKPMDFVYRGQRKKTNSSGRSGGRKGTGGRSKRG